MESNAMVNNRPSSATRVVLGRCWELFRSRTVTRAGPDSRLAGIHQHSYRWRGQNYSLSLQTLLLLTALYLPAGGAADDDGFYPHHYRAVAAAPSAWYAVFASKPGARRLALFLTFFVMGPVFDKIYTDAYEPYTNNKITMPQALEKGAAPLKAFMMKQTREADLALFVKLSGHPQLNGPEDVPLRILVPAFVTSELKTAFQIGFAVFIPFLIIDMVVASVLMSMGMMMVSPALVALPFKIMLFVLVDGWHMLIGSLAESFY